MQSAGLGLVDWLADPQETRPAKADTPAPASKAGTHRFKQSGKPARYELFGQVWLSLPWLPSKPAPGSSAAPSIRGTAARTTLPG